ncbi:AzlC family ABC transporter permease [Brockia lithotrophica]|uniref:4-azaleucine resistance transporter AzlC n=1 Tax=Brockia lithotrophica TaxID=933949 RepID=A0A660L7E3_9BACL|nr:AzlC family ABC transporter permease [Brockia lithotrophica]RKQ88759.1 4-azaleucine resistance transporter AzlC [Brockia lithotrophica]
MGGRNLCAEVGDGARLGLPVALGYIPIGIAFGLVAKEAHLDLWATAGMSALVFAGAGQLMAVHLLLQGTSSWLIALLTYFINLRHMVMGATLAERQTCRSPLLRAVLAFFLTDETYAVAQFAPGELTFARQLALGVVAYSGWVGGSVLGYLLGAVFPADLEASFGIALYAMFLGLLVPNLRGAREPLLLTLLAVFLSAGLHAAFPRLPGGVAVVVSALLAALPAPFLGLGREQAEEEVGS